MLATISTLTHHGIIYVPLGYSTTFDLISNLSEVHGGKYLLCVEYDLKLTMSILGSPWGSGTFAAADGSRQPTDLELQLAARHGKYFYGIVNKVAF